MDDYPSVYRKRSGNVVPFEEPRRRRSRKRTGKQSGGKGAKPLAWKPARRQARGQSNRGFIGMVAALCLATFSAILFWGGPPQAGAVQGVMASAPSDTEHARFTRCSGPIRYSCVVDGDTIWYEGTKIRLADINAPELSEPQCAYEARLAERATDRLTALLNAGNFSLGSADRAHDKYGRELKVIRRGGRSIGGQLVSEGLAESWKGYRRGWC